MEAQESVVASEQELISLTAEQRKAILLPLHEKLLSNLERLSGSSNRQLSGLIERITQVVDLYELILKIEGPTEVQKHTDSLVYGLRGLVALKNRLATFNPPAI